eukprot:scaffold45807_cov56-Phaeocystis_antarctica.AAC.5
MTLPADRRFAIQPIVCPSWPTMRAHPAEDGAAWQPTAARMLPDESDKIGKAAGPWTTRLDDAPPP